MRNIINFFLEHSAWLTFLLFAVISCSMLFNGNPYQQHVYLSSAGSFVSGIYKIANNFTGYFHLRDINHDLQQRNAALEMEAVNLREELKRLHTYLYKDSVDLQPTLSSYHYVIASVINNSVSRAHNYVTIDKGELDGIRSEMGVVDQNGVVGIVNATAPHTALIISLLNSDLRLSCKVKGSDAFGSLVWDGHRYDQAILEELPRHVTFSEGDTVITSGYSVVFPEGIPVGIICGKGRDNDDDNFYSLHVKLLTDFSTLSTVRVISNDLSAEISTLSSSIKND